MGTVTCMLSPSKSSRKPSRPSLWAISSLVRCLPRRRSSHRRDTSISAGWSFAGYWSQKLVTRTSGYSSRNRLMARDRAWSQRSGSMAFSYREEASVRLSYRRAVRRTPAAWKLAISRITLLVVGRTESLAPPMTPARPTTPASSAMTRSSADRDRALPLSSSSCSPSLARRTMMCPAMLSESKAWVGWPVASIT